MTLTQRLLTILLCIAATQLTRFLPFAAFAGRQTPRFVRYLGKALPAALFGMLVVYCLKNVTPLAGSHGLPELLALVCLTALHLWRRNTLLSIAGGTVCYMLLVQLVF